MMNDELRMMDEDKEIQNGIFCNHQSSFFIFVYQKTGR